MQMSQPSRFVRQLTIAQRLFQMLALALLAGVTLFLVGATALAAAGVLPWPDFTLGYGGETVQVGMTAQIGLTLLALALCGYLPMNNRVMTLEKSHRRFEVSMNDIARAYHAAHAADRSGAFQMSAEFDSVRERIRFLREHPDLSALEPELLEAAAQMSHISQELADTYSDSALARAREFLRQRQEEIEQFNDRLADAKAATEDLRQWSNDVEIEESIARSQIARLKAELNDILPELGLTEGMPPRSRSSMVPVNKLPAE